MSEFAFASRRSSSTIPPAPPLPPSKQLGYFQRFVAQPLAGYGSRPASAQTNRPDGRRPNPLVPRLPGISSGSSQDASHKTGLEITAVDTNFERTHAVLAGREILKTIRVQDANCAEETNLRAAIINYAAHNTSGPGLSSRHREALEIHDVKWSHGQFNTHIATAAANGKVILYDLNRAGMELARLHEHHRQVHKLAFNPHFGALLLSASQDATVRLWDLRDMRKDAMTCHSKCKFPGMSEGIRDVVWSPTDGVEFAFGTDNGVIQRWDYRQPKAPKLKINAHEQRICFAIDWHPDGKHLLSAGVDKTVKVWDFSSEVRRQKPAYTLRTPYPVHKARWRPPYWSDEFHEKGVYQCTQFATSYDRDHSVVHVWDFRRPFLPFREINKYSSAPSDLLWHSRDNLWTVGREGVFTQTDVHFSPKVMDRRNLQAFAVSPSGEVGAFAQKRSVRRRAAPDYVGDDTYVDASREKRSSPEKNSLRSSADDSLDDSFLSSSFRRHHGRTASNRSTKSFASTPPASDIAPKVMYLTESMALHADAFKPNQVAFRGALPAFADVRIFTYLAQKYKAIALPDPPTLQSYLSLQRVFEQNAQYAQRAAFYRLAETWRVVGAVITTAARRRAELHMRRRSERGRTGSSDPKALHAQEGLALDRQSTVPPNPAVRAILGTEKHLEKQLPYSTTESTSNIATPLVRPTNPISASETHSSTLPDPDHAEQLSLPPALSRPHSVNKDEFLLPENANRSQDLRRPSFNGPQWYNSPNDIDERRAMIGTWRAPPRAPLSLDPPTLHGISINIPPRLDRHNSDESFAMFSASTDSQRGTSMPSSFASEKIQSRSMDSVPEKWSSQPADSSFGNSQSAEAEHPLNAQASSDTTGTESLARSFPYSPTSIPIGTSNGVQAGETEKLGAAREGMDPSIEYASRDKAIQDIQNLRRNNQLLRHDSSESEAFMSDNSDTADAYAEYNENMEASGTIVPEVHEELRSPHDRLPASLPHAVESAPSALDPAAEEPIILSDFLALDLDAERETAFQAINLLREILAFHAEALSDAQTPSLLLLLLAPLLPRTHPLSDPATNSSDILSTYADHLTSLGLTPTQTQTVLSTQLTQLLETGINPYQAESILLTYHTQLHSLSLFNAAASIRRLAYPTYPAVYEQALKDTSVSLLCLSCKSPINNPRDKMKCESCKRAQAPCPICWARYPAYEDAKAKKKAKLRGHSSKRSSAELFSPQHVVNNRNVDAMGAPSPSVPEAPAGPRPTLWTWCPLCGHGGHTACLSTWFENTALSEGACATEGCLCDCVRGKRREVKLKEAQGRLAEKEARKPVRGDEWKIHESKAVGVVRGALGDSGAVNAPTSSAGPNGTASWSGGRRETGENRRVRVLAPDDSGKKAA